MYNKLKGFSTVQNLIMLYITSRFRLKKSKYVFSRCLTPKNH